MKISHLTKEKEVVFYSLMSEYLPDCEYERMREYQSRYPEAFLICEVSGETVGIAFGRDRSVRFPEDDSFELCGIAIRCEYQRKGCGRTLLTEFEKAAKGYGAKAVSLGSAEGYAELF